MSVNNGTVSIKDDPTALYGYIPSEAVAIIFIVLFSLSTLAHVGQAVRYRQWFLFSTAILCGSLEILGWASRLWSSFSPLNNTPFKIEITATIIAPTPLLAANFVIFGRIIRALGQKYSRMRPRLYTIIFTSSDVASLVVQGLGGGVASSATTLEGANRGSNIMLGGIVFQLIIIVIFSVCAIVYFIDYNKDAHSDQVIAREKNGGSESSTMEGDVGRGVFTPKLRTMTYGVAFSTIVLFIRGVYRIIELADGWHGRVIHTQVYFNVLDGMMIVLAIYTINFVHPGMFLPPQDAVPATSKSTFVA
ncbi:RTA1-like protein [Pholiota molesta]|nr:RTA1-like protein [Pholiota molesta]